jgi:hypothetical protein
MPTLRGVQAPIRTLPLLLFFLVGCKAHNAPVTPEAEHEQPEATFMAEAAHSPPFARLSYGAFRRADAVAIAEQEWRRFGNHVDDDPPAAGGYDPPPDADPARAPGHWERIGEYWWLGQNADRREAAWTGMHDENGRPIADGREDYYAWSAAFISYVMRTAGAGPRFPYSPSHYTYINTAKDMAEGHASGWALVAEPVDAYAPAPGDVICYGRERHKVRFTQLPLRRFAAHCDIVVARDGSAISVIGGNVDHTVTMKHVPVTKDGRLADPDGDVLDARYPWFVVLKTLYDR